MQNQSKTLEDTSFAPIPLNPDFPISDLDYTERCDMSPIPPHVHDCFELGYCHRGSGIFLIEDKVFSFNAGDVVVINNRETHIMTSRSSTETTLWNFVNLDPVGLLCSHVPQDERFIETDSLSGSSFQNLFHANEYPVICRLILDIMNELRDKESGYQSTIRASVWRLMVLLHRLFPHTDQLAGDQRNKKNLRRLETVLQHIALHFSEPLEMEKLASLCYTSVPNFRKLFHSALGCSPSNYIKKIRLEAACVLLKNSKNSIFNVAISSGFPTLSNFNRQFKQAFHLSPTEFRKQSE